jgi:hypothetical protein
VRWLVAVQSQEYGPSKWALGQRSEDCTDETVEDAYVHGELLRTHVLRPTWHSTAVEDIRWLLRLTSPRIEAQSAYRYRQLELDDRTLGHAKETIAAALAGGRHLTRRELAERLADAGVETDGQRLAHIVFHAELAALICSGPRHGKQQTYALLDERAPGPEGPSGEEAMAELGLRFFTSHGPACARDLAWWATLKVSDAKRAAALAGDQLESFEFDGRTYWHGEIPDADDAGEALLLPDYDETFVGYRAPRVSLRGRPEDMSAVFERPVTIDGVSVANWKRRVDPKRIKVWLTAFSKLTRRETAAIDAAFERYEAFMGLPVAVETVEPS